MLRKSLYPSFAQSHLTYARMHFSPGGADRNVLKRLNSFRRTGVLPICAISAFIMILCFACVTGAFAVQGSGHWTLESTLRQLDNEAIDPSYYRFAVRRAEVIERFGRYPYRNATLGRESTDEEREFLSRRGASF